MDSFIYTERHRTIICKVCKCAVSAGQFRRHIQDTTAHRSDFQESESRQRIVECFISKETVVIGDLIVPTTTVRNIEGLDIYTDGLMCDFPDSHCRFISRRPDEIKRHCRQEHGWVNPNNRGRPVKESRNQSNSYPWVRDIKCQQFFKTGPKSQLFEVSLVEEEASSQQHSQLVHRAGTQESDWKRRMEQERRHARILMERADKEERDLVHKAAKGEINPWIERTGWASHLEGQQRRKLVPLIAKPDPETEPELVEVGRRFDKIITIAQKTVIARVNTFTRMEINRKEFHSTEKKPFNARLEVDTKKRYCGEFKAVIWYILRVWTHENRGGDDSTGSETEEGSSSDESDSDSEEIERNRARARSEHDASQGGHHRFPKKLPKFQMSTEQKRLTGLLVTQVKEHAVEDAEVAEMSEENDEELKSGRLDETNRILLQWCIELFNHKIGGLAGDDFNSPVIAALAVVGIAKNGAWVSALSYTPKLSAIVKLARMMVVQHAWEVVQDGDAGGMGLLQHTRKMVEGFMTTHEPTPMKWIHDVRRYGMKIRMTTASAGTIRWYGDRLQYQNKEFTRLEFQSMVHGLVDKAHGILIGEVFCFRGEQEQRDGLPHIPWESLHDNPAEDEPGWGFMDDRRNEWPVDGKLWLAERIWSREDLRKAFIQQDESVEAGEEEGQMEHPWRVDRVAKWIRSIVHFKELLLLLMHITGGGPARTSEILSIRYRNTAEGGVRNIFVENGLIVFVTAYHKGYALSGQPKVVYRYLPQEVGELLMWYIWLALPLQQQFEMMVRKVNRVGSFLWSPEEDADGRKWTGERMKRGMMRETGEGMGVELGIADYRQCAAAMTDKYLGKRQEGFDGNTEEDLEAEEDEEGSWWDVHDQPIHLQFAHSSYEAGIGYARNIEESGVSTVTMRLRWRAVSEKWHRHLRFPSAMGSSRRKDGQRPTIVENDWQEEERRMATKRWKAMQKIDIQAELERLMGPGARFRGVQEVTLQAVLGGKARILSIMGTGSGKSLVFMLPATFKEAGTTIVIVPMTSLRADMKRRCNEVGIECAEWDSRRPPEKASIVLVTPESVSSKGFHGFMNRLRGMHRLDRIVIDECHTVLDSSSEFRPSLLVLREVMEIGCQVVMLTATLPPMEEHEFMERMGIDGFDMGNFRAKTTRRNIAYEQQEYDGSNEGAVQRLKEFCRQLDECGGKMIVYVRGRRERVEELAEEIGWPAFHGKMSKKEKGKILADLTTGKTRVVVATNALGMGIDIPDIRMVVHVDAPDSLRYYGQESGRAGRDGRMSRSIILSKAKGPETGVEESESNIYARAAMQMPGRREMEAFVRGKKCRRIILDGYLDGDVERLECESESEAGKEEVACDICRSQRRTQEDKGSITAEIGRQEEESAEARYQRDEWDRTQIRSQNRQAVAQQARFEEVLRAQVEEWANICAICKIQGRDERGLRHLTSDCKRDEEDRVKQEITSMRQTFRVDDFAGCRGCGLPQGLCQMWTATPQGFTKIRGGKCQWRYVLIDVVVAMMFAGLVGEGCGSQVVIDAMCKDGVRIKEKERVYRWFASRVKVEETETNHICRIFVELVEAFQQKPEDFRSIV